jgi:hypothetical protein
VAIHQVASTKWSISLSDQGKWSWQRTKSYSASRSSAARASAEWILEAPTVGGHQTTLPQLSTALFGPTSTFAKGGTTHKLAQGNPIKIVMVKRSGPREATPSGIASDQQSFNDCAYSQTCPAP